MFFTFNRSTALSPRRHIHAPSSVRVDSSTGDIPTQRSQIPRHNKRHTTLLKCRKQSRQCNASHVILLDTTDTTHMLLYCCSKRQQQNKPRKGQVKVKTAVQKPKPDPTFNCLVPTVVRMRPSIHIGIN